MDDKICKVNEFGDVVYYRAICGCGACDMDLWLEKSKDTNTVTLELTKKLYYASYWENTWYNRIIKRFKGVFKLLFTGYIKVEESFLFNSTDQVDSFIKALEEGKEVLLSNKELNK